MNRVIPIRYMTAKEYKKEQQRELEKLNKTLNNTAVVLSDDDYKVIKSKISEIEKELM